ncbi:MAG: hypothetical protein C0506_15585 [Anaerolinea sp.]|nr:hypothetical protein [Anaerolinea sp.]
MTNYPLYIESGPKKKTTQVHVLVLLGCVVQGLTTEDALAATPAEIGRFLAFLNAHGESVDLAAPFTTTVAAHVMEGSWIGHGDPAPGFEPDFAPLGADELATHLRRLGWLREDLLALIGGLAEDQLLAKPEKGRPLYAVIEHVASAHYSYTQATVGKVEGLLPALKEVQLGPAALSDALPRFWSISTARLAAMTREERTRLVPRGEKVWTARRGIRRTLEHEWEHFREIERRLKRAATG